MSARENSIFHILLPISAIAFFVLILPMNDMGTLTQALLFGIVCAVLLIKVEPRAFADRKQKAGCLSVAAIICITDGIKFYRNWMCKVSSALDSLLAACGLGRSAVVLVLAALLGLAAFIFSAFAVHRLWDYIKELFPALNIRNTAAETTASLTAMKALRSVAVAAAILLAAVAAGTGALMAAYSNTGDNIEQNAYASAVILEKEGEYPSIVSWWESELDNSTDALMLLEASDKTEDSPIHKAMLTYRGNFAGLGEVESLTAHYLEGREYERENTYSRYWHGYLILLIPLLNMANYGKIRLINGAVQLLLMTGFSLLLTRRGLKRYIVPVWLLYLMLMPAALAMSLQFSSCFYIMLLSSIAVVCLKKQLEHGDSALCVLFFITGICLAYFDFLTYPAVTLGVPLVLVIGIRADAAPEKKTAAIIKAGVCWLCGYAGMWVAKWVAAGILTGGDAVSNALSVVSVRVSRNSGDGISYSILQCIWSNLSKFMTTPVIAAVAVYMVKKAKAGKLTGDERARDMSFFAPYVLTGLLSFVWYALLLNHSSIHTFFTNKACSVPLFAALCALADRMTLKEKC